MICQPAGVLNQRSPFRAHRRGRSPLGVPFQQLEDLIRPWPTGPGGRSPRWPTPAGRGRPRSANLRRSPGRGRRPARPGRDGRSADARSLTKSILASRTFSPSPGRPWPAPPRRGTGSPGRDARGPSAAARRSPPACGAASRGPRPPSGGARHRGGRPGGRGPARPLCPRPAAAGIRRTRNSPRPGPRPVHQPGEDSVVTRELLLLPVGYRAARPRGRRSADRSR